MLEHQYKKPGYMHDEVMREILKKRNAILTVIFRMIGRQVLPNLEKRRFWSQHLNTVHPGHDKDRNNEHICTMMVILEALLEHLPWNKTMPVNQQAAELLKKWVTYWNEQESETALSSNTLLTLLDGLAKEVCIKIRGKGKEYLTNTQWHPEFAQPYPNYCNDSAPRGEGSEVIIFDDPEYMETFFLTEVRDEPEDESGDEFMVRRQRLEFIITAKDLYTLLNRYCANQHIRNPFDNPTSLGARISNDMAILKKGGWEFIQRRKEVKQYKKIDGNWNWRFSKKIIPMGDR
jgi:DNA primase